MLRLLFPLTYEFTVDILAVQHLSSLSPPPEDSWLASALKYIPPSHTVTITPMPVPSPPPPHAYILYRRHASHVFRFHGCWSLFRLLLFAFRRFRSFPRSLPVTVPSHRTSSQSLDAHPPDGHTSNSAPCGTLLVRITLRRQFAISLSHRSECFFIALHCFRVSSPRLPGSLPWGLWTCIKRR